MKRLLILSAILMMTATAFAFGGGGHGRKAKKFTSGVDAIGVHFNGKGQANVDYTDGSADTPITNILGRACADNADPVYRTYPTGACCSPSGGWFCPEDEVPSSDCTPDPSCGFDKETCLAQGGSYDKGGTASICCLSGISLCVGGACACVDDGGEGQCSIDVGCIVCAADTQMCMWKCYPKNVAMAYNYSDASGGCHFCPFGQDVRYNEDHYICYNPETEDAACPYYGECIACTDGKKAVCGEHTCICCSGGYHYDSNDEPVCD